MWSFVSSELELFDVTRAFEEEGLRGMSVIYRNRTDGELTRYPLGRNIPVKLPLTDYTFDLVVNKL